MKKLNTNSIIEEATPKRAMLYSPLLVKLSKHPRISEVYERLDRGDSVLSVVDFINVDLSFKISKKMVYTFSANYQQAKAEQVQVTTFLKPIGNIAKDDDINSMVIPKIESPEFKSELDMLDLIMNRGVQTLVNNPDKAVQPEVLMMAIKLKNELTQGAHMNLTPFGIQYLQALEKGKFKVLTQVLLSYIPADLHEQVMIDMEEAEEEYMKQTDYYEEYRKQKDLQKNDIEATDISDVEEVQ